MCGGGNTSIQKGTWARGLKWYFTKRNMGQRTERVFYKKEYIFKNKKGSLGWYIYFLSSHDP